MKAEEALTEAQETWQPPRRRLQERQAQVKIEQARAKAERTLEQIRKAMDTKEEHGNLPPSTPEEEGIEQRISFILRLTVDERGQPRRTEVEHAQSGKKETFSGLDVQRLVAFMKACISPPNHPGTDDPPSTSHRDSRSPNIRAP